jgi:hypothetical protein
MFFLMVSMEIPMMDLVFSMVSMEIPSISMDFSGGTPKSPKRGAGSHLVWLRHRGDDHVRTSDAGAMANGGYF